MHNFQIIFTAESLTSLYMCVNTEQQDNKLHKNMKNHVQRAGVVEVNQCKNFTSLTMACSINTSFSPYTTYLILTGSTI